MSSSTKSPIKMDKKEEEKKEEEDEDKCEEDGCANFATDGIAYGCLSMSLCKYHYDIAWADHPENPTAIWC